MAEDLKRSSEICTPDLLVLYEDDGLFVKYSDGTSLELSPCGSAFLHREAAPSNSTMRQFTRFALSSIRPKIAEAVRFRNLFAARPYLCKELTDLQQLKVRCSCHYETDMCICTYQCLAPTGGVRSYPGAIDIFNFWVSIIPTQELFEHVKCPHTKDTDTETTKSALLY